MSNQLDSKRMRQEVERELQRTRRRARIGLFMGHVFMSIIFTIILWAVALNNPTMQAAFQVHDSPLPIFVILPTILAFASCMFHGFSTFIDTIPMKRALRDQAVLRVLGREVMRQGLDLEDEQEPSEKPKRDQVVRLSDDGELVTDSEVTQERTAKSS